MANETFTSSLQPPTGSASAGHSPRRRLRRYGVGGDSAGASGDLRRLHDSAHRRGLLNIKTSGISCAAANRALHRYHGTGEGLNCRQAGSRRWRCTRGPAVIRYSLPRCGEGICSGGEFRPSQQRPSDAMAVAARACGSFRVPGLQTAVRVRVKRGSISCGRALAIMRDLFVHARRSVQGWRCVGPQTGYAACTKGNSKITASF